MRIYLIKQNKSEKRISALLSYPTIKEAAWYNLYPRFYSSRAAFSILVEDFHGYFLSKIKTKSV